MEEEDDELVGAVIDGIFWHVVSVTSHITRLKSLIPGAIVSSECVAMLAGVRN